MAVTVGEYAKRRGVSPQAIRKAIASGRLRNSVQRKATGYVIDPEVADAEWTANTQHERSVPAEAINRGKAAAKGDGAALQFDPNMGKSYSQFRAYGEGYKAKLLELEYKERAGLLVRVDEVKAQQFKTVRLFRDAVQNIPVRVVNELAAIVGDLPPDKRHEMMLVMQREIDRTLSQLADSGGPR